MKKVSVIVPIYNEGKEFKHFLNDLYESLRKIKNTYEVIVLDSYTSNSSWDVLKEYCKKEKTIFPYLLRHPGITVTDKTNKYMFGFEVCTGDYIITMDGDGQDRPEEIHKFIKELDKGFDFVIGYKQKRRDGAIYMLTSKIANGLIRKITGVKVHDMNNGFKAFQVDIARSLNLHSGHFRFIPVIASARKWRISEVKVEHRAREFGGGKFSFKSRLQGGLFDMWVVYIISKMGDTPMYTIGWTAIALMFTSLLLLLFGLLFNITIASISSLLLFFTSLNLIFLGLLLEYIRVAKIRNDSMGLVVDRGRS